MKTIRAHSLASYFVLTFAISWGLLLMVVGPSGMPVRPERYEALLPLAVLAMLPGPPIAGLVLTALLDGRAGLRDLFARLIRWRVDGRWYVVALLAAPVAATIALVALSPFSRELLPGILLQPNPARRLVFGVTVALGAGFFEELGWTGFALPRLRERHGVLRSGLILGFVWGAWHLLANVWAGPTYLAGVSAPLAVGAQLVSSLLVFRVAMVWVYEHTQSLFVAVVMHASLTATTLTITPLTTGVPLLAHDLGTAFVLWIWVVGVGLVARSHVTRVPLARRSV